MSETILVIGYGPVGRATVAVLAARGATVRVAQRRKPADLPAGVTFVACDVRDRGAVARAIDGAAQVVMTVGLPYDKAVWAASWPPAMTHVVEACTVTGARAVFVDNLYMLGPQDAPLTEDMPLTTRGGKAGVRAEVTRIWQAAAVAGRVRIAALRCPDFYGPEVGLSHIGDAGFGRLAQGKTPLLLIPPDTPHDFAYVPDIARAVISLLDAPDDAYGQVWNMPCAPTRTPREIIALGAAALGVPPRLRALPMALWPLFGLAVPFVREADDMRFLFDRPYRVDAGKFRGRFWSNVTPFEVGAPETARSFQTSPGAAK